MDFQSQRQTRRINRHVTDKEDAGTASLVHSGTLGSLGLVEQQATILDLERRIHEPGQSYVHFQYTTQ